MLTVLSVGLAALLVSVLAHSAATGLIVNLVAGLLRRGYAGRSVGKNLVIVLVVTLIATAGHLAQVAIWAATFLACGEFGRFDDAFYHSAVNYTTLGYGDIVMSPRWRLLGPIEALNGVLLFGVSTALMFTVISRLIEHRLGHGHGPPQGEHSGTPGPA
jgi:carbon starvation protein CstA